MTTAPQLFVEVKGYLELVNTVDEKGNYTDEKPLLTKLINAPPPMTKEEAEATRKEAEDARKAEEEAKAEAERVKQESEKAAAELEKKATEQGAKHKQALERVRKDEAALKEEKAEFEKQKVELEKAKKQTEAEVRKQKAVSDVEIAKLKNELKAAKGAADKKLEEAVKKQEAKAETEKRAAAELKRMADQQVEQLKQDLQELRTNFDKLKEEAEAAKKAEAEATKKAEAEAAKRAQSSAPGSSLAQPTEGDMFEQLSSGADSIATDQPAGDSAGANNVERLLAEHESWRKQFLGQKAIEVGMPDSVNNTVTVIEQTLAVRGQERYPAKSHFVRTKDDELVYRTAMKSDPKTKEALLKMLSDKKFSARQYKPNVDDYITGRLANKQIPRPGLSAPGQAGLTNQAGVIESRRTRHAEQIPSHSTAGGSGRGSCNWMAMQRMLQLRVITGLAPVLTVALIVEGLHSVRLRAMRCVHTLIGCVAHRMHDVGEGYDYVRRWLRRQKVAHYKEPLIKGQ
ncbi:putative transmembrane protein [Gregarina niphandrodes]|uniref:Transmembrane protein n=1 Tax=Gregarina niphandrodes TaxID=110365 RepID=A0A023B2H5_GRENI|nr:putative transmembrane protein [Gregarina niphandrodes]EZG52604.1 putative transmembrane protein [Gregarina niphandrodes]|eukprot:XP_011131890.1 putative transmembrane protein [Gregarina niphandrodes]